MRIRAWGGVLLVLAAAGCACQNPNNTPLLTALDEGVQPESASEKVWMGALFVPVTIVAGAADVAVLHPVQALGLAAEDAHRALWAGGRGSATEKALTFVPKLALTPVVFAVAWVGESLFDLRPEPTPARPPDVRLPGRPRGRGTFPLAFGNRRNRPLMNLCERNLVPDDPTLQALCAPVTLPTCLAAGVVDSVVIRPVAVVGDACRDTGETLWRPTGRGYATNCAVFIPRAAVTPPLWSLYFVSRFLFNVPPWPPEPDGLEAALTQSDADLRVQTAMDIERWSYTGAGLEPATDAMLKACRTYPKDRRLCEELIARLPRPLTENAVSYLREVARTGRGRLCAAAIYRLFTDCWEAPISTPGDPTGVKQGEASVRRLAHVYEDQVKGGHHEAEVYLLWLAGRSCHRPGPRSLAMYVMRSLAKRKWPAYAEAVSFETQIRLFAYTAAARIDAAYYEWRALRLRFDWRRAVQNAVARARARAALKYPVARAAAVKQHQAQISVFRKRQSMIEKELPRVEAQGAVRLVELAEELMGIKTRLDAEDLAQELLRGPKADLELFMGDPLLQLVKKGEP